MVYRLISRVILLGASILMLGAPSYARQPAVDIVSRIDAFQPVALGEDINLSPCGSTVVNTSVRFLSNVCDTGSPDSFSVHYLISFGSTTSALSFGTTGLGVTSSIASLVNDLGGTVTTLGNAAAGLRSVSIATGAGSLFSTAGTYVISLIAVVDDAVNTVENIRGGGDSGLVLANTGFTINGASVGNFNGRTIGTLGVTGGSNTATGNGRRNVAFSQTRLVINPAAVPEPSSLFMLLMAGLMLGGFHYRRRVNTAA